MKKDTNENKDKKATKVVKDSKTTKEVKKTKPAKVEKDDKKTKDIKNIDKKTEKKSSKTPKEKKLKLPSLFKKKYSEKRFQRKILKKIYIPDDKKYVQSFFIQEESDNPKKKGKLYIPHDKILDKKDLKRLKTIAKQIKGQKGRIKFMPLVASVSFIVLVITLFIATKNVFLTKVVRNLFEYQFEAKCDIAKLDLKLLDSSFTVKGFEIADKNQPMTNLFSFDSLIIDFDLTQLLKAKFVADELSINEMAVGSSRTYDGTLSEHKLKKIRNKKAKHAKKFKESSAQVQQSFATATDKVKNNINDSIVSIFETFNPKNIIENCYSQMTTPKVAKKIQDETIVLINKWKDTPDRVMKQVQNVQQTTENIINFDYNSIKDDPRRIKDMLQTFQGAFDTLEGIKNETENVIYNVQEDFKTVESLAYEVQDSLTHDVNVTNKEIEKLTSFRLPTGQEFLASSIDIYGHELLGKYYPYAKKGIDYLVTMKDRQVPEKKPEKKEEPKKQEVKRAAGRDIYFVKDRNPKFWIKKIAASGFNMECSITDLANDMNKTERPTKGSFSFDYKDITHGGKVVVDIRTETENPLVYAEYTCDGTSFAHADNIPGVPEIKTNANYMCNAKVIQDEAFVLSGLADFYNLKLSTPAFEPAYIHEIYNSVLGRFDSAEVELEMRFDANKGLIMHANSDLDKKIATALTDEITQRLTEIKDSIEKELTAYIKSYVDQADGVIAKFTDIKDKLMNSENELKNLENRLKAKQQEFTNKMESAQKKVQEGIENKLQEEAAKQAAKREQAKEEMRKKNEERKQAAEAKAEDALKGFLGGLKK